MSRRADIDRAVANGVTVWTDGSMYNLHTIKPGGWAYVVVNQGREMWRDSGPELLTTVNRMELRAVIEALKVLPDMVGPQQVILYSDSQYVVRGTTEWLLYWRLNGWQKSTGGEVANRDLWEELYQTKKLSDVRMGWVRGHTGVEYNEVADQLAGDQAKGAIKAWDQTKGAWKIASGQE